MSNRAKLPPSLVPKRGDRFVVQLKLQGSAILIEQRTRATLTEEDLLEEGLIFNGKRVKRK